MTVTIQISSFSIQVLLIFLYYSYCSIHHLLFGTIASTFISKSESKLLYWTMCYFRAETILNFFRVICCRNQHSVLLWSTAQPYHSLPVWESYFSHSQLSHRNSFIHLPHYLRNTHYVPGTVVAFINQISKNPAHKEYSSGDPQAIDKVYS